MRRRLAALAFGLLLAAVADQVALRTVLADGTLRGVRLAPYAPALFHPGQDAALAEIRGKLERPGESWMPFDAELGWEPRPDTEFGLYAYDARGARVGNAEAERPAGDGVLRVAAFGCSFTQGDEVAGSETWAAELERLAPVRVDNFGVSGYGLDQALLRMRRRLDPGAADEVWFGLLPGAVLRVTTCYRPLVAPWSTALAFKPRFDVEADGGLALVPDPARSLADVVALMDDPARFVATLAPIDPWVARCEAAFAPRGSRLAHHSAAGRLWLTWRVRSAPDPPAELADPTSRGHRTLLAVLRTARREVEAAGLRFRVVVLPGPYDLRALEERGSPPWSALVEALRADGTEVLDVTPALDAPTEAVFVSRDGHYSAAGNGRVVRALADGFGL